MPPSHSDKKEITVVGGGNKNQSTATEHCLVFIIKADFLYLLGLRYTVHEIHHYVPIEVVVWQMC